jgi:NAD/NADP transhydrogenase alpha subunit
METKMIRVFLLSLLFSTSVALAQTPTVVYQTKPTADEIAFARLPPDLQQMLGGMTAAQAMQTIAQTGQQAIALGVPRPSPEQFRTTLGAVLNASTYISASAGMSTFPPLSPLVAPPPPPFLR